MLHRIHNGLPVKRRGGPFGSPGHREILFSLRSDIQS